MPDSTLKQAIREAYASNPTSVVVLDTLEFRHPSFVTPLRVVSGHVDASAKLEATAPVGAGTTVSFTAWAFKVTGPDLGADGAPQLEIEMDNAGAEMMAYFDLAANSADVVEVTFRRYLDTDLTGGPQNDPPITLTVKDISTNLMAVSCKAGFRDYAALKFPGETYTQTRFPGLVS